MRYALERIKGLFIRARLVFVPVAMQQEQNIAEREQIMDDIAILMARYRNRLYIEGMQDMLADEMALQMQAIMMGADE